MECLDLRSAQACEAFSKHWDQSPFLHITQHLWQMLRGLQPLGTQHCSVHLCMLSSRPHSLDQHRNERRQHGPCSSSLHNHSWSDGALNVSGMLQKSPPLRKGRNAAPGPKRDRGAVHDIPAHSSDPGMVLSYSQVLHHPCICACLLACLLHLTDNQQHALCPLQAVFLLTCTTICGASCSNI